MIMLKHRYEFEPVKLIPRVINCVKLFECFQNFINEPDLINKKYGSELINEKYLQMTITRPSNLNYDDEKSYDELLPEFKSTYIEEVLQQFKSRVTRVRLIIKKPGGYILPHIDYDTTYSMRYYIPLITNPWSITSVQVKKSAPKFYNLLAEGNIYFVNPGYLHAACNLGSTDDVRLTVCVDGQLDYYD